MQYITTSPEIWKSLKPLAKSNRFEMTLPEKVVWNIIRKNQLGVKFRRQQVIFDFIVDFVCLDIKLAIEIDGESHNEQVEYDSYRTNVLNELGYKVVRFSNNDVMINGDAVKKSIKIAIETIKSNPTQPPLQV